MKIHNATPHASFTWKVYLKGDGAMLAAFDEGIVHAGETAAWLDNSGPRTAIKVVLASPALPLTKTLVVSGPWSSEWEITFDAASRTYTVGPVPARSLCRGPLIPGVTVTNFSYGPVHVALSYGGVIQQVRNNLGPGDVDFLSTGTSRIESATGGRRQQGLFDLTIVSGMHDTQFDSSDHNAWAGVAWGVTVVGGVAAVPLAAVGGWAAVLAGAGGVAAVGGVVLVAESVKLTPTTILNLDAAISHDVWVYGQEYEETVVRGRKVLTRMDPIETEIVQQWRWQEGQLARIGGDDQVWWLHRGARRRADADLVHTLGAASVHDLPDAVGSTFVDRGGTATLEGKLLKVRPPAESVKDVPGLKEHGLWWVGGGRLHPVLDPDVMELVGGWQYVHPVGPGVRHRLPWVPLALQSDGKLVAREHHAQVWWLHDGRRYAVDHTVLEVLGGAQHVHTVTKRQIEEFPDSGEPATAEGQLLRARGQEQVWWVHRGKRHLVRDGDLYVDFHGGWQQVRDVTVERLERFPLAPEPATIQGRLARDADGVVWRVRGTRRERVFNDADLAVFGGPRAANRVPGRSLRTIPAARSRARTDGQLITGARSSEVWLIRGAVRELVSNDLVAARGGSPTVNVVSDDVLTRFPLVS